MHSDQDDVDRLFARLETVPVPDGFATRVLASTTQRAAAWPLVLAGLVSLVLLAASGYQLGANLASTDALDLLEAVTADTTLLTTAPGDVVAALGEVMPWGLLGLSVVSAACVVWCAARVAPRARRLALED